MLVHLKLDLFLFPHVPDKQKKRRKEKKKSLKGGLIFKVILQKPCLGVASLFKFELQFQSCSTNQLGIFIDIFDIIFVVWTRDQNVLRPLDLSLEITIHKYPKSEIEVNYETQLIMKYIV